MTSLALALVLAAPNAAPVASPSELIQGAIDRYHYAGNLSGKIEATITVNGQVEQCTTTLQISSPDRMYFEQFWPKSPNFSFKSIANGEHFVYPKPDTVGDNAMKRSYLVESMKQYDDTFLDYRGIYAAISKFVSDRSIPLEIVMGRLLDLEVVIGLLSNLSDGGVRDYNGEEVNVVFCDVRNSPSSQFKLKGAFFITKDFDIRYFKTYGKFKDEDKRNVEMSSEWDVKIKVNDKDAIDPKLYNLDLVNGR